MSVWRLVLRGLIYHHRIQLAVVLGVAAATAVLTGALLVGDSVRGSLRALTLERLGRIDEVLVTDRFFSAGLVERLEADPRFEKSYTQAVGAVLFPQATVERQGGGPAARAADVTVIGCDAAFWELDDSGIRPERTPQVGEVVLNETVASEWGAEVGDRVVVRLPKANQVPADSPLAQKSGRIRSISELRVIEVLPAEGLGRFSLRPSQRMPRNVYLAREQIQDALDQEGRINAILVAGPPGREPPDSRASRDLAAALDPTLEDYGLQLQRVRMTFAADGAAARDDSDASDPPAGEEVVYDYFNLTTDRMVLPPAAETAAARALAEWNATPVLTYLANSIARPGDGEDGGIPYSTITAVEFGSAFPLRDRQGARIERLADDQIVLNEWAAEDLDAGVGDTVRVSYFEPETTHGETTETRATFTVAAITPLTEPSRPFRRRSPARYTERPTLANDPDLTPVVEGITDQESIDDWDAPFPFDYDRVRGKDDEYWQNHRTTPKAFLSLPAGQRLWGSRFGRVTSFRIPARDGLTREAIERRLLEQIKGDRVQLGLEFIPVKRQQLAASSGTTPFDVLFLGLSFFIIAAALLLVALLFRLGVEQRAGELGTLLAVGLRRRMTMRILVLEGLLVAAAGGLLGVAVGIGYAWGMLYGLRTWWVGAITTPFLEFHWTAFSLCLGYALGVLVSLGAIAWSVWRTRGISIRRLLAGQAADQDRFVYRRPRVLRVLPPILLIVALVLSAAATRLAGMPQAGAFFGSGAAVLTGLLLWVWAWLRQGGSRSGGRLERGWKLSQLALRNAARNPARSATTVGLMATASFLIVAMSSFRVQPTEAGVGGFNLMAESAQPVFEHLGTDEGRDELLADQAEVLAGTTVLPLRLRPGDDASCNNLYQSAQPRVIGMTDEWVRHFDGDEVPRFRWAATAADSPQASANPWRLLHAPPQDGAVPTVIDMNTAMYSLKPPLSVGSTYTARYDGRDVTFRVVGLLENSILQGGLMVSEHHFESQFPEISGYRMFLIRTPAGRAQQVTESLEDRLGDQGFDVRTTAGVLAQLLAVQNTYLTTFQTLGALGLLLGTFGLATVQLRNVLERRGELAVLRAAGFRQRRIGWMVMIENLLLLGGGLLTGVLAALLAVLPHKVFGEAAVPPSLVRDLALMLVVVFAVGVLSSLGTIRATLRAPILAALRGD